MTNKEKYIAFCEESKRPLIFQSPKWLNAVVGESNWDVVLSFKGKELTGAFPFVSKSKFGVSQITLPPLTSYLGPIIIYPSDISENNTSSFKRKVLIDLVSQLPQVDRFITHCDLEMDYWLPFYWEGYEQTTRYTYLLPTTTDIDSIYQGFKLNVRKSIDKASEHFNTSISENSKSIFDLYQQDLIRKGMKPDFNWEYLQKIDHALPEERIIIEAKNKNNEVVAGLFLLMDDTYLHYSFGAVNEANRNSGVMSWLIFEAIKLAKEKNLTFNFGGSMNRQIEQYFQGFKPALAPYFRITKVKHPVLKQFKRFYHQ